MYQTTAFLYDSIAAFEEPEKTGLHVQQLLAEQNIHPPGLVGDLGAGTGVMAVQLAYQGWQIHGVEQSASMLAVAQEKKAQLSEALQSSVTFTQGDITGFTLPSGMQWDAAVCLCNTINHLVEWSQVEDFARSVFQALKPGGVLIFDSDTKLTFQQFFHHGPVVVWEDAAYRLTRECQFNPETGRAHHVATLEHLEETGLPPRVCQETMLLQYHSEIKLYETLTAVGFEVKSADPYNPNPQLYQGLIAKLFWVVRKPSVMVAAVEPG